MENTTDYTLLLLLNGVKVNMLKTIHRLTNALEVHMV